MEQLQAQQTPVTTVPGLSLAISFDQIQAAFQSHLDKLLEAGTYNNPVRDVMDKLLGYSGSMRGELAKHIEDHFKAIMDTPQFQLMLGQALANEMARRATDALQKK